MKGNAGECQVNVQEWRQSARGMQGNAAEYRGLQGNARGTYGSGCKVPEECWGMQWKARVMHGSGCKLPGECRECRGMPGIRMGVGVECQRNEGDYQGNAREWV